jgi:hypothetical protein
MFFVAIEISKGYMLEKGSINSILSIIELIVDTA